MYCKAVWVIWYARKSLHKNNNYYHYYTVFYYYICWYLKVKVENLNVKVENKNLTRLIDNSM
jgi:hypothetical protein